MKRIEVEQRTILIGLAGSHGYGLNRPDSDLDFRNELCMELVEMQGWG